MPQLMEHSDDPDTPPLEVPRGIPELVHSVVREQAVQRLPHVRANLRLLDPPAAPSAAYEAGLCALGLLDFPSSGAPRRDLVAELIANKVSSHEWSSVHGASIEVSLDTFAEVLSLPGKPIDESPANVDPAVVTSAAREFLKAYILTPLEAASDRKRRLPDYLQSINRVVNNGYAYIVDWAELIWQRVEGEMAELAEGRRPNWACYYGAYLQRLIWVERPDLFHLPPGESVPRAPAPPEPAASRQEQAPCSNQSALDENQKLHLELESKLQELEARSKQMDAASENLHEMHELNKALVAKERKLNDEVQRARKALIEVFQKFASGRANIAIKRMGELDKKAFANDASLQNLSQEDAQVAFATLSSHWQAEIQNSKWHPFRVVKVNGEYTIIF